MPPQSVKNAASAARGRDVARRGIERGMGALYGVDSDVVCGQLEK